jgi:hypothetical protein
MSMFTKAQRKKAKLRLALCAPSGGGKTYSALTIASGLGGKVALIDTERGSGELYAPSFDYDVCQIGEPFSPKKYIEAIHAAEASGYDIIVIDSLTHAWAGSGGILDEVDKRKSIDKNDFTAWRTVTPQHNALVDAMLQSPCHIIATMRTKTAYEMETNEKGKKVPVKVGMAPIQRDGMEFEFTVVLDISTDRHLATASKDRTGLFDGQCFLPTVETGRSLRSWLDLGLEPPTKEEKDEEEKRALADYRFKFQNIIQQYLAAEDKEKLSSFMRDTLKVVPDNMTRDQMDKILKNLIEKNKIPKEAVI